MATKTYQTNIVSGTSNCQLFLRKISFELKMCKWPATNMSGFTVHRYLKLDLGYGQC